MKEKLRNIFMPVVILVMPFYGQSESQPKKFQPQMLFKQVPIEDFTIVKLPIKPIEADYSGVSDIEVIKKINDSAYKYLSFSGEKSESKYLSYVKEYPCLQQDINTCSPHERFQIYDRYKIDSFINGVIGQAKAQKKIFNKVNAFDFLEQNMNVSGDEYEPKILSAIEEENVKGNALLKGIAAHCVENTPSEDVKNYMKCLLEDTKKNDNVFLNIKTKCLIESAETTSDNKDFMSNLQSCTNKETLSAPMLAWIAFQSYRLGAIYYEKNKERVSP